jgi:D-3-phosphoglycerate dehydrogenase
MEKPFVVLVSPEAFRSGVGPYADLLRSAGVEMRFPRDPLFGLGGASLDERCIDLADVDAVIASMEPYDAATLDRLPRLKLIARAGVGYDRVDVPAATERGVVVTITPTANFDAVAEMTFSFLLSLAKRIPQNDRAVRAGRWPRQALVSLRGKTLGVVGLGRIGKAVAKRAAAFDMTILAYDATPHAEYCQERGIECVDLDDLLQSSEFVTLHVPAIPATRRLMNRDRLARMKPGSYLINTARGALIDEEALYEALRSGHLAGAALDVLEVEPPPPDHPLLSLEQVIFAPHVAGVDEMGLRQMAFEAAECAVAIATGGWPHHAVVNPEVRGAFERRFRSS